MQQYEDIYLLLNYATCFGRPSRPSSEVHKTVVAASGTDHIIWGASFLKDGQIRTHESLFGVQETVVAASGTGHIIWGASFHKRDQTSPYLVDQRSHLVTFEEACSPDSMISYQRLQLQFYVLPIMGAMDARNM